MMVSAANPAYEPEFEASLAYADTIRIECIVPDCKRSAMPELGLCPAHSSSAPEYGLDYVACREIGCGARAYILYPPLCITHSVHHELMFQDPEMPVDFARAPSPWMPIFDPFDLTAGLDDLTTTMHLLDGDTYRTPAPEPALDLPELTLPLYTIPELPPSPPSPPSPPPVDLPPVPTILKRKSLTTAERIERRKRERTLRMADCPLHAFRPTAIVPFSRVPPPHAHVDKIMFHVNRWLDTPNDAVRQLLPDYARVFITLIGAADQRITLGAAAAALHMDDIELASRTFVHTGLLSLVPRNAYNVPILITSWCETSFIISVPARREARAALRPLCEQELELRADIHLTHKQYLRVCCAYNTGAGI